MAGVAVVGSFDPVAVVAGSFDRPGVDVQVIPYLVVHVFPWWLAVVVLPGLGRGGQWWRVD